MSMFDLNQGPFAPIILIWDIKNLTFKNFLRWGL